MKTKLDEINEPVLSMKKMSNVFQNFQNMFFQNNSGVWGEGRGEKAYNCN